MSALAYLIFLVVALGACALGAVGAYFYYRARHREAVLELEALDQDLNERHEELRRLQYQFSNVYSSGAPTGESALDMQKLREELEQKKIDYNILKQDFDLETGILKQEVEQLRKERSEVDRTRRHIARKESELDALQAELEQRRTQLEQAESAVKESMDKAGETAAVLRAQAESKYAARLEEIEKMAAERRHDLDQRARDQEAREVSLKEREEQIDEMIGFLSQDKFSSREEAILAKRLRQQIKLQREELETLHTLYRRMETQLDEMRSRSAITDRPPASPESQRNSFPSFSAISSYMEPGEAEAAAQLDADRLTEIPGIDARLERELFLLGITSFDQVARLSSADVRRISERLGVPRDVIQDQWIVAAQSHLYARS